MDYAAKTRDPRLLYVLMFHQVNDKGAVFYPAVPTRAFEQICDFLLKHLNVIHFSGIREYFQNSRKSAAIITFDDGHYDILKNAHPILKRYGLKFNINISTESLETHLPNDNVMVYDLLNAAQETVYVNEKDFPAPVRIEIDKASPSKTEERFRRLVKTLNRDERKTLISDLKDKLGAGPANFSRMLSKEDVLSLYKEGAELGSHTHTHQPLPGLNMRDAEFELTHSKKILEDLCGRDVDIIALPQGLHNEAVIRKAREAGYKHILLTGDKSNVVNDKNDGVFYRVGLYHKTADENLARIFGFHRGIHRIRDGFRGKA